MDSRYYTWDLILGGYGSDLRALDMALQYTFSHCNIDPQHIAICGFSDGASYALSLGISNGHIFTHLMGYSPGMIIQDEPIVGKPKVYISHGTDDQDLPIEVSRELIYPTLIDMGYDVNYYEFRGGHTIPASVIQKSLDWFLENPADDSNSYE
jgi:phospholipase/carboxylesterase